MTGMATNTDTSAGDQLLTAIIDHDGHIAAGIVCIPHAHADSLKNDLARLDYHPTLESMTYLETGQGLHSVRVRALIDARTLAEHAAEHVLAYTATYPERATSDAAVMIRCFAIANRVNDDARTRAFGDIRPVSPAAQILATLMLDATGIAPDTPAHRVALNNLITVALTNDYPATARKLATDS